MKLRIGLAAGDGIGPEVTRAAAQVLRSLDPSIEAGAAAVIDEGDTFVRDLSFDDIGTLDTHSVTADFGEGATAHPECVDKLVLVAPQPLRKDPHWAVYAERFFRELRVDRIWEGTSEIQRLIIARALMKRGLTGM